MTLRTADKLPAIALLDTQHKTMIETFYGDMPVCLGQHNCVEFTITPTQDLLAGMRLRLGTYSRQNHCHIMIKLAETIHRFSAQDLIDNEYHEILFEQPVAVIPNQALTVNIYSDDADEKNYVALWCSQIAPPRVPLFPHINLPAVENPDITIVLPICNQVEHTLNCLLSIVACDPEVKKQLILINNASTDATADLLASLPDSVVIIQNPHDLGFLIACRQAGGSVQAKYLLLLHQQTQLVSGYFKHLLAQIEADPMIGAVGGQILYPDGHLFSAGGIVFNNGDYCHYGQMQDPTTAQFNQSREMDYCSDIGLLVKTDLWHQLGGFDERYAPVGYQDIDLCFGLRQAGYSITYCPQAKLIYYPPQNTNEHISQAHFVAKWESVLSQQPTADIPVERALERLEHHAYEQRREREISRYAAVENVHDLPDIFHYWSNKYLLPMGQTLGFNSVNAFFCEYMQRVCAQFPDQTCRFVSIGAGNCDLEVAIIELLRSKGADNFVLECLDINPHMLARGTELINNKQLQNHMFVTCADINSWETEQNYHIVMASQSLHHFVELELLFDKINTVLHPQGYFLTDDMIGRNGHMRWNEALALFNPLWAELPERYKYNHLLKRVELEYDNWDCSVDSFEGIRAQDILPLLIEKFGFDLFLAYGNVIDVFIDRCFGHNFDIHNPEDLAFIDKVHAIDQAALEAGKIKPTHMVAALTRDKTRIPRTFKHLTPEFCVRLVS